MTKEDLKKRNRNIFKLYIDNDLDIEKCAKKFKVQTNTIKLIIKKYVKTTNNVKEIIKYNQKLVLEKTDMSKDDLKVLYELFVKYDWNIPIDNPLINQYPIDFHNLYMNAKLYHMFFIEQKSDIIYDNSYIKFDDEEKLRISQDIVKCYIDEKHKNNYLIKEEFCLKRKIFINQLYQHIRFVEKYNKSLYQEYEQLEQQIVYNNAIKEENTIHAFIEQLINGKEDQGIIRNYDSIDFELEFNNDVEKISTLVNELYRQKRISLSQLYTINSFFNKIGFKKKTYMRYINNYPILKDQTLQDVLNSYREINCQRDKKGYPIKGTGTVIGYNENKEIMNYLQDNDLTLNYINFLSAINRITLGIKLTNKVKKLV